MLALAFSILAVSILFISLQTANASTYFPSTITIQKDAEQDKDRFVFNSVWDHEYARVTSLTFDASTGVITHASPVRNFDSNACAFPTNETFEPGDAVTNCAEVPSFSNGLHYVFLCQGSSPLNSETNRDCNGVNFGHSGYPTLSEALASDAYYFTFDKQGAEITFGVVPDGFNELEFDYTYETRFLNAIATASNTLNVTVEYFIDTNDFSTQWDRPDVILINVSNTEFTQVEQKQKFILPLTDGISSTTLDHFTEILQDGEYTASINFWNFSSQQFILNRSSLTLNFTINNGLVTSQAIVSNENALFPEYTAGSTQLEPCGITNITGCIINALRFLFVPSQQSIDQFSGTWEQVKNKPPFGYITSIIDEIGAIDETATPAWEMPTLPFLSSVFDPLKTALAVILWGLFGVYFYQRVTKIEL